LEYAGLKNKKKQKNKKKREPKNSTCVRNARLYCLQNLGECTPSKQKKTVKKKQQLRKKKKNNVKGLECTKLCL